jgi:hypothetical protein
MKKKSRGTNVPARKKREDLAELLDLLKSKNIFKFKSGEIELEFFLPHVGQPFQMPKGMFEDPTADEDDDYIKAMKRPIATNLDDANVRRENIREAFNNVKDATKEEDDVLFHST